MITAEQYAHWLARDDVQRTVLVEATCYRGGAEVVNYLSDVGFVSRPGDTPPNQPYDDLILSVPEWSTSLSDGLTGAASVSWGDIEVSNASGERDSWLSEDWDGRAVRMLVGDQSWSRADFRPILSGVLEDIGVKDRTTLLLKIRDKQWALTVPAQTRDIGMPERVGTTMVYRVSDSAVDGIDAASDNNGAVPFTPDIAAGTLTVGREVVGLLWAVVRGQAYTANGSVPLAYGKLFNVSPKLISRTAGLYQVHDGAIKSILAVYDNGVSRSFTADLATGTFVLSAPPVGTITVDMEGAVVDGVYLNTVGKIIRHLVANRSKLSAADIDEESFAAFDVAVPATVGLYVADGANVLDLLDALIQSVGGWYGFARNGLLRLGRLEHPVGVPKAILSEDDWDEDGLAITARTLPRLFTKIGYARFWTVQTDGLAEVTPDRAARLRQEYLVAQARADDRKTVNLLADEPAAVNTLLSDQADAQAEAERQNGIYDRVRTTASVAGLSRAFSLDLGDLVQINSSRYGMNGKLARVTKLTPAAAAISTGLEVWL